MENSINLSGRIQSIDIMRGLTLFLMLFVNDLYMPGVPKWLGHTEVHVDGMGLADWVFPGFLFMVGLSIPYAFKARIKNGDTPGRYVLHSLVRSASLIFIGVLMVNIGRLNPELTGIGSNFWALAVYLSIFLIWNNYKTTDKRQIKISRALQLIGTISIILLLSIYRSGTELKPDWLIPSWWGILGLIGWSYLVGSLVYCLIRDNIFFGFGVWIFFIGLNAAALNGYTGFLDPLKPIFGVILNGNTPSIVLAGLFSGILLAKYKTNPRSLLMYYFAIGFICLVSGFALRNWFIISKIIATPSWAMICNGISFIVFAIIFYLVDQAHKLNWFSIFRSAGANSLTTYLAPDFIYYFLWGFNLPLLIYKQNDSPLIAIAGSLLWALIMIKLAAWLSHKKIQLKL